LSCGCMQYAKHIPCTFGALTFASLIIFDDIQREAYGGGVKTSSYAPFFFTF
jgi:hypothetical protein